MKTMTKKSGKTQKRQIKPTSSQEKQNLTNYSSIFSPSPSTSSQRKAVLAPTLVVSLAHADRHAVHALQSLVLANA